MNLLWAEAGRCRLLQKTEEFFLVEKERIFEKHDSCHQIPEMLSCRTGIKLLTAAPKDRTKS